MPFDFATDHLLLEVDGAQHFQQVSNWNGPEEVQEKDIEKIVYAIREGYSVIHISQEDIWKDTHDWKKVLREEMEKAKETPQCVFISKQPLYNNHIEKLGENHMIRIVHPSS